MPRCAAAPNRPAAVPPRSTPRRARPSKRAEGTNPFDLLDAVLQRAHHRSLVAQPRQPAGDVLVLGVLHGEQHHVDGAVDLGGVGVHRPRHHDRLPVVPPDLDGVAGRMPAQQTLDDRPHAETLRPSSRSRPVRSVQRFEPGHGPRSPSYRRDSLPLHCGSPLVRPFPGRFLVLRSHAAGSLRATDAGQKVTLAGWVARRRDHGGVIFIDLRDASGVSQVVFREAAVLEAAHRLRAEFCIAVDGVVEIRPEGNANPEIATGDIEVNATSLTVLGESAPLPFQLDEVRRRGGAAEVPLSRSAARRARRGNPVALQGECGRTRGACQPRLHRDRDADADPVHAGGRPRLPGARAPATWRVLRAAAEPAAVQAAADGGRDGALLPDRAVLPRRGLPRRPAAGVHPARHGDELRRLRRRHRGVRADPHCVVGV